MALSNLFIVYIPEVPQATTLHVGDKVRSCIDRNRSEAVLIKGHTKIRGTPFMSS